MAEVFCLLLEAGHSRREIAGFTDAFVVNMLWCKRDKHGRLLLEADQKGVPEGVEVDADGQRTITKPVPLSTAFRAVARRTWGLSREETDRQWAAWLTANPKFGKSGHDDEGDFPLREMKEPPKSTNGKKLLRTDA